VHHQRESDSTSVPSVAAEDSTRHVHFRVMPRMPRLRYLRLTDLSSADDSSASGESYL
jgi:hypothetical protein